MTSYIDKCERVIKMNRIPLILEDYLNYMETIKGVSSNTVKEYYYDLNNLFKFIKIRFRLADDIDFKEIDISDIDLGLIKKIKLTDLHAYISYADKKLKNGNSAKARKVASARSFFEYLHLRVNLIDDNPAIGLEFPKGQGRNPIYLTLNQANHLLNIVLENKNELFRYRDYAIILLFLTCGLRLSELASIDINKIQDDNTLSVIGKGNKERVVFLNDACVEAIDKYLEIRPKNNKDNNALFLSIRKQRMSNRAIQHMIDRYLKKAGFDTNVYSTHKLRHTAATLMYKYGNVDIRALQEILGHESVSTTQIYTHLDDERLRDAIERNPLSSRKAIKTDE